MGDGAGRPTAAQLTAMEAEVAAAMRAGAFGISSALIYPPDSFQTTEDLIALARIAGRCDGFYATHMRDESAGLIGAIAEAVRIGEEGGVKVEIFHLKAAFAPGWGQLMPQAVAAIEAARARGIDIAADLYPYPAGGTGIDISVPGWVWADGMAAGLARLRDPALRERLKRELAAGSAPGWSNLVHASGGWSHVVLANSFLPAWERFHGQNFEAIGRALNRDPADVAWDIIVEAQPRRPMALFFMMSEADIDTAPPELDEHRQRAAPRAVRRDGRARPPHPRAYGTFRG